MIMVNDTELLAKILSDGKGGYTAMKKARALVIGFGSLNVMLTVAAEPTYQGYDLTDKERNRLATLRDMSLRVVGEQGTKVMCSTQNEAASLASKYANLREEVLIIYGIGARNEVVAEWKIATGWESGINIHPRQIYSHAVRESIGRIIMVHNHPSGNPQPSDEDLSFTRTVKDGCKLLGIDFLDHIVIAREGFVSMRAEGVGGF